MLDTDENQDFSDDQLSPSRRKEQTDDKFDELIKRGFTPEEIAGMEDDAINGAIDDKTTAQDKTERDGVDRQTNNEPDLFNPEEESGGKSRPKGFFTRRRNQVTVGLGVLVIGGGGFGLLGFINGAGQLFQLNDSLGKPEAAHVSTINTRLRRMFFRSTLKNADDRLLLSRSRLGVVQNRVFGGMLDRLKAQHGITFTEITGITGDPVPVMEFDLPDGHPLKGRSGTITKLNVARDMGIDAKVLKGAADNNGRFKLTFTDLTDAKDLDKVKFWGAKNTGGGSVAKVSPKLAVSIHKRMFAKVFRLPSLFHPKSRATAAASRKIDKPIIDRRARKQADAERSRKSLKVDERISSAKSDLRSNVKRTVLKTAATALAVHGVMCMVRDIADIVPKVYYATVVMPSMIRVVQTQGVASQLMSGQDFTADQLGDALSDLKDSEGRTVWGAKPLNALTYGGGGVGTDIDSGARSAFTTKGSSIAGLTAALGYDDAETGLTASDSIADWACSPVARVFGLFAGAFITVAGIVGTPATGGGSTAVAVGRVATQAALSGAITYAVSRILGEYVEDRVGEKIADSCGVEYDSGESGKPEDIQILNAESFGSCMAFAARMSSNINAASMGGVPISSSDELALYKEANDRDIEEFKQKSLPERLFSTRDSRSLLMTALRPAAESGLGSGNIASLANDLFKIPRGAANNLLATITPRALAEAPTYDWGFPMVSLPPEIAEDPQYDSAENVRWITENRSVVKEDKVRECFGKEIVGEGDKLRAVLLENEVNPLSEEYNEAGCGDLSDPNWIRTALFVMDDSIAAVMDCYDGAEETCAELGLGGSGGSSGYAGTGNTVPCTGQPTPVTRISSGSPRADWSNIKDSGVIGKDSAGKPIKVYIREACDTTNVKTIVIVASIHGSENGGQFVGHELLFNESLPSNIKIVVIPELNSSGLSASRRKNANGVDLNRNNDHKWLDLTDSDETTPSGLFYKGVAPGSEPETQAINSFLSSLGKVNLALFYHDKLEYVSATGSTSAELAKSYGAAVSGLGIGNKDGDIRFSQKGSIDGWYNSTTGSPSLLVEMSSNQSASVIAEHVNAIQTLIAGNKL